MTGAQGASYEVAHERPLVVLGRTDFPAEAAPLADRLAVDYPGTQFVAVVSELDTDDDGALLEGLRPCVQEVIFTASGEAHAADPAQIAMRAVESFGFGQDFVFTVPRLADAIDHVVDSLSEPARWEGTAVLVVGHADAIDEARQHLLEGQ